jgi:LCP family protein required for cell wall assembly
VLIEMMYMYKVFEEMNLYESQNSKDDLINFQIYVYAVTLCIVEAFFCLDLFLTDSLKKLLPENVFLPLSFIVLVLVFFHFVLTFGFKQSKLYLKSCSIFLSVLLIFSFNYSTNLAKSFNKGLEIISSDQEETTIVSLLVKKDAPYENIDDLVGKHVGIRYLLDGENNVAALNDIHEKLGSPLIKLEYDDFDSMVRSLISGETESLLINDAYFSIISDRFEDFFDQTRVVYQFKSSETLTNVAFDTNFTTESYNILLSGVDESGTLSDVNLVATVNPKSKKILLTTIPRDTYVAMFGDPEKMDKLTHAGIYGIEASISTIQNLLGIELTYYVKVNFMSLVNIIDALGGIVVNSDMTFSSRWSTNRNILYHFEEGPIELDGQSALAFSRERKSLIEGDRARGRHQQEVIKGILNKMMSPSIITNIHSVLDAISANVNTNIRPEQITSLIQMQFTDMAKWEIDSYIISGDDDYQRTYSYGSSQLFVLKPHQHSLLKAREQIEELLGIVPSITATVGK